MCEFFVLMTGNPFKTLEKHGLPVLMKKLQMKLSRDTEQVGNKIRTRQTQSVTIHLNKYPILPGILKMPRSGGEFRVLF